MNLRVVYEIRKIVLNGSSGVKWIFGSSMNGSSGRLLPFVFYGGSFLISYLYSCVQHEIYLT